MRIVVLILGLVLACSAAPDSSNAQADTDSTYTVQSGDTLYDIARQVGVSVRRLMVWNDLEDPSIQAGQTLRVRPPEEDEAVGPSPTDTTDARSAPNQPTTFRTDTNATSPPSPPDTATASPNPPVRYGRHDTETGDTFVTLALRLGTTADTLFALNDSVSAPLQGGRTLRLPPRRFGPPTHVVQPGETLYSIAGEYGVSVRSLKTKNDLDSDTLEVEQRLRIPGRPNSNVPPLGQWADPDSTGRVAVYPDAFAGRLTASGTTYSPDDFVVSHPSLPFGSVVLLSAEDPARHTFARVIDRGPVEEGVLLNVSQAVAQALRLDADEASSVALRVVWIANGTA
jgi:LysM repeat protein